MKFFSLFFYTLLFFWSAFDPSALGDAASLPSSDKTYETATKWPGTTFKIILIKRLNVGNVLMAIRISADATAPNDTLLGFLHAPVPKPVAAPVPIKSVGPRTGSTTSNEPIIPRPHSVPKPPDPFSLLTAFVIDEADQAQFNAVPQALSSGQPFYGPSEIVTGLRPRQWLQMSVQFPLPEPPPRPDGTVPDQKVDVTLPQALAPIKGVVVPPQQKMTLR
jgi:hypothetical protein